MGGKDSFIREENFSPTFPCPRRSLLFCFIGQDYITWSPSYAGRSCRIGGDSGHKVSKPDLRKAKTIYLSWVKISAFEWRILVPTLDHFSAYVLLYKLRVKLFSPEVKNFCGLRGWGELLKEGINFFLILYQRLCCHFLFHCGAVCLLFRGCDMMW